MHVIYFFKPTYDGSCYAGVGTAKTHAVAESGASDVVDGLGGANCIHKDNISGIYTDPHEDNVVFDRWAVLQKSHDGSGCYMAAGSSWGYTQRFWEIQVTRFDGFTFAVFSRIFKKYGF